VFLRLFRVANFVTRARIQLTTNDEKKRNETGGSDSQRESSPPSPLDSERELDIKQYKKSPVSQRRTAKERSGLAQPRHWGVCRV